MSGTLRVAESFLSIQGEGKLAGVPSYFIRVSGCNLRCGWCDTPYASWNPEGPTRGIDDLVREGVDSGARHAVLTGGEPMMFDAIGDLARGLKEAGLHITVETAGTVHRSLPCDLMSISPKLSNSAPALGDPRDPSGTWRERHKQRRLNMGALQLLFDEYAERQLKFVVAGPGDVGEIEGLLAELNGWSPADVMLMPEGVKAPTADVRKWVAEACVERGWRYCARLHIELFGNVRGT